MSIDEQLQALAARLEQCAQTYGNKSFLLAPQAILAEFDSELIDLPGWLYVLWGIAARKQGGPFPEATGRATFLECLAHRMHRGDRGDLAKAPATTVDQCLRDIEVLAMDAFAFGEQLRRRLIPIVRAIEVAHVTDNTPRGRRGSRRDPRSDD